MLLKFEVLDRPAEPVQIRERLLGDDFGHVEGLRSGPEACSEKEGETSRPALLAGRQERVADTSGIAQVGIGRRKLWMKARDVGELTVGVPGLVFDVVKALLRDQVHENELLIGSRSGLAHFGARRWRSEQEDDRRQRGG